MNPKKKCEFTAFASYSTSADYRRVRVVERFLETFHKRVAVRDLKLTPIQLCVDGSDFSILRWKSDRPDSQRFNSAAEVIEDYLSRSRRLLVFVSRHAMGSPWVQREIGWWLANRLA